jgi:hypothetical protein
MWHYVPVKTGTIAFSVWRKTHTNRYKVVGTNKVVVKDNDNMATLFSLCSASCKERTPYFYDTVIRFSLMHLYRKSCRIVLPII